MALLDFATVKAAVLPVGSVLITISTTNPGTSHGGTWSRIAESRILIGLDTSDTDFDTVEETGGSATVTLAEANLPAHSHGVTDAGHSHQIGVDGAQGTGGAPKERQPRTYPGAGGDVVTETKTTGITLNATTGGGSAHDNWPPYIVAYIWKRTA